MDNITTCITDLASRLMNTNTAQSVNGQKTFSDLYFRDQSPTYGTVMNWINHDISPVFGAGGVSFSRDGAVEEGRFTKPNVSGVVMDCALKNPVFSMNHISITGGVDNRGYKVLWIDAPNVPLASFDSQKLGQMPDLDTGNIQPYYWATSKNCSGTVLTERDDGNLSGGTANYLSRTSIYTTTNVIAAYNEAADKIDLLQVSKDRIKELPSNYTSIAILCKYMGSQRRNNIESFDNISYLNLKYENGIYYKNHYPPNSGDPNFTELQDGGLVGGNSCIALLQIPKGRKLLISGKSLLPSDNSPPGEVSTVLQPFSSYQIYAPFIMENGNFPISVEVKSKGVTDLIVAKASRILKVITGKYFI